MIDFMKASQVFDKPFAAIKPGEQQMAISLVEDAEFRCAHCGFVSEGSKDSPCGHLEIHISEGGCRKVLCPLCHAGHHVHYYIHQRTMTLIAAPWISQAELNLLMCTLLGCAADKQSIYFNDANTVYDLLFVLQKAIPAMLPYFPGNEATQEANLILLIDAVIGLGYQDKLRTQLQDIRYLPLQGFKPEAMDFFYNKIINDDPPPARWEKLLGMTNAP